MIGQQGDEIASSWSFDPEEMNLILISVIRWRVADCALEEENCHFKELNLLLIHGVFQKGSD